MNQRFRTITLWMVIILAFVLFAQALSKSGTEIRLTQSELMTLGETGELPADEEAERKAISGAKITSLIDENGVIKGEYVDASGNEQKFASKYYLGSNDMIVTWARENGIPYDAQPRNDLWASLLSQLLILALVLGVLYFFISRQFQSGSNKAMSFGKSRAKLVTEGQVEVSFDDVAGIDEVKEELQEIIEFLKNPDKFSRLGGKIPKGALLYGPPGSGKTLIARATAGEASVPFFSISGSDFVEMFVGVGASRVRDLFEQGKRAKPCLIYIDEIDAVGRQRFSGFGGGHDEREQTLNQLLVELDGFAENEGVIVMASTNRLDVLDPALLRPGRFDRQIRVDLPDVKGREKILEVHTRSIKISDEVNLKTIAKGTPGFSGADLANLANEAALLAARADKEKVEMEDMEEAKDRVMMGPMRKSLAMTEEERVHTAYHETGHALVAKLVDNKSQRVHKVTIIPRGRALGVTAVQPEVDKYSLESHELEGRLRYIMGGRAAEKAKFNDFSTGASNDLQQATDLAHRMVCEMGMSDKLGPRTFGKPSQPLWVGRDMATERDYSEVKAAEIDDEVDRLVREAYEEAYRLIDENKEAFERISLTLLDRETLSGEELDLLLEGKELPPLFRDENGNGGAKAPEEKDEGMDIAPEKDTGTPPTAFNPQPS